MRTVVAMAASDPACTWTQLSQLREWVASHPGFGADAHVNWDAHDGRGAVMWTGQETMMHTDWRGRTYGRTVRVWMAARSMAEAQRLLGY